MKNCPCGSKLSYETCCGLYHDEKRIPQTPEVLMRSRYSAYAMAHIDYIKKTMYGKPLATFNEHEAKTWAKNTKWLKLKIINTHETSDTQASVEFVAFFIEQGQHRTMHEKSEFQRMNDRWYYVDGILLQ